MSERKILVVDDEAAIRGLLRCAMSAPGVAVYDAHSGAVALDIAAEHAPFDLVITDVLMPGMDGIALARKLSGDRQAQRFLFISGYCDLESMPDRIADFPVASFLAKPFSIPELLHATRALLEEQPQKERVRSASVRDRTSRSALERRDTPLNSVRD